MFEYILKRTHCHHKKKNDTQQSTFRQGRFSDEAIEITEDVSDVLEHNDFVQPPTVLVKTLKMRAKTATTVEEQQGIGDHMKIRKPQQCSLCHKVRGCTKEESVHYSIMMRKYVSKTLKKLRKKNRKNTVLN